MVEITAQVQSLSSQHSSILSALAQLDYAPPAFERQAAYVQDVADQLAVVTTALVGLKHKTAKEKREADDLKGSLGRGPGYRLTGRKAEFEEKATKEQR